MRTLGTVTPTPEQVSILSEIGPGPRIIRGAAGSGKTTTAILRLKSLLAFFVNRRERMESEEPVRALVLTFNRTLRGYVQDLVESQVETPDAVQLEVATFAAWAVNRLGRPRVVGDNERLAEIRRLGASIPLRPDFLEDEVEY